MLISASPAIEALELELENLVEQLIHRANEPVRQLAIFVRMFEVHKSINDIRTGVMDLS